MAFIALVLAALFAVVALAAFAGGEPFLGVMAAIGCLMVLWVGGLVALLVLRPREEGALDAARLDLERVFVDGREPEGTP